MSKKKEIAITTAYIAYSLVNERYNSIIQMLDKAYDYAVLFVEKYPLHTKWGLEEGELDWEETVYEFLKEMEKR